MVAAMEVELDARRRAPLAKVLPKEAAEGTRYRVQVEEDGTVVLTPVHSLTERELSVLARPELVEGIRRGVRQIHEGKGVRYPAGHFSKLAGGRGVDVFAPDDEN